MSEKKNTELYEEETVKEETAEHEEAAEDTADDIAEELAEESGEESGKAGSGDAECPGDAEEASEDAKDDAKSAEAEESERYMRLMAEFQNFKRRSAKEKSDIHAYANEKIVTELLPVLDNFERALDTTGDDIEGYAKGMELIFEQLKTALEHAGLKEIESAGETFDPNVHNAVMTEESDELESGKVGKVLQKGYKLNDKVIRPAMVSVVK